MHKISLVLAIFFISSLGLNIYAQNDRNVIRELYRLKLILDRTSSFIDVLPESDFKTLMLSDLQKAQDEYGKAVDFADNNQNNLAKAHILLAYQYLKKIENLIKNHPVFKIKYRERLDLKIQQAEEIVQTKQKPEALHMLNRAKFFRQRAYLSFRGDQSFNALEYYRLAIFFADKAIQITTLDERDLNKDWTNLLSETEMLLERAKQLVDDSQNSQLISMIEKANSDLQEIRSLNASERDNAAKNKLLVLHRSLYRIIDLAENVPQRENDRVEMDFETLKFTIESLNTDIQNINSPATNRLYFRTTNMINSIENHINKGELVLARQKIFMANRLILNIYRLIESNSVNSPEELQLQIEHAQQNLEELQNTSSDLSFSAELLNLIKVNLDNADRALNETNYIRASFYLKMANRLILKFNRLRLLQSTSDIEAKSAETELQRLENLLNRIDLNENTDQDFSIRYENSKKLFQVSQEAFLKNDFQLSHELTTMAINLITQ